MNRTRPNPDYASSRRPRFYRPGRAARDRGSVYILVLGASLMVAAIGISSLNLTRVQARSAGQNSDRTTARELARSAIDRGLFEIQNNPLTWRTSLSAGLLLNITLDEGEFSLTAVDQIDGDLLNNNNDPAVLIGTGRVRDAKYMLSVNIDSNGNVIAGTWKRVVN